MSEYHKVNTIWKRDMEHPQKPIIEGEWVDETVAYLRDCEWVFTEKIDGTNVRVLWDGNDVEFRGRTDNAQMPPKLMKHLAGTFRPDDGYLHGFPAGTVFYGEGFGAGIQKGGLYGPEQAFCLFDVRVGDWWLERESIEEVAKAFDIPVVPVVGRGALLSMIETVAQGFPSAFGSARSEGVVARPAKELRDRAGNRIIVKLKERDFAKAVAA